MFIIMTKEYQNLYYLTTPKYKVYDGLDKMHRPEQPLVLAGNSFLRFHISEKTADYNMYGYGGLPINYFYKSLIILHNKR